MEFWCGVLAWSLEWSFGEESGVEFWCGVWSGVLRGVWSGVSAWSLEWSFGVESGVHFQSSVIGIYINNFSTCNFVYVDMDL